MSPLFNVNYLSELIIKRRALSMIGSLVLFILCVLGIPNLTFSPDIDNFFPENNETAEFAQYIDETFLPTENVVIAINTPEQSLFNQKTLHLVEQITEKAWTIPHSVRADSITNYSYVRSIEDDLMVEPFIENALELSDEFIRERELAIESEKPIFGSLISRDKRTTIVNIVLDPVLEDQAAALTETFDYLLAYLEEIRAQYPDIDIRLVGTPYVEYLSPRLLQSELPIVMPSMFLLIFATVYLLLRNAFAVIGTVVIVILSLISAFGGVGHMDGVLNQVAMTIPILITTLALADCVHLLSLYFQNVQKGLPSQDAMKESLKLNLQPLFLTTLTTSIGFLCLNFAEVYPLRLVGNGVAIGVTLAFIYTIFFLAPAISFFTLKAPKRTESQTRFAKRIAHFSIANPKAIFWGVPIISVMLFLCIPLNTMDDDPTQMYSENYSSFAGDTIWLDEKLGGTFPVSFVATSKQGSVSDPVFLRQVDQFSVWLESQPEVKHVTSLANTMKTLNQSMHGDEESWYLIPESDDLSAQYLFFYEMSLPFGLDLNSSISQDRMSTKVSGSLENMTSYQYLDFEAKVDRYISENDLEGIISRPSSFRVVYAYLGGIIISQLFNGLLIGIVLITIVLGVFFRSVLFSVLSVFPNVLPIALTFGVWGLVFGNVSFMVGVGMGSTLGIIVDFSVHLLSKYNHARTSLRMDQEGSVVYAFETVGFALVIMTAVLCIGFLVLNTMSFLPLHDFARFSSIAFLISLVIDLLLFPNLLIKFDRRVFE